MSVFEEEGCLGGDAKGSQGGYSELFGAPKALGATFCVFKGLRECDSSLFLAVEVHKLQDFVFGVMVVLAQLTPKTN